MRIYRIKEYRIAQARTIYTVQTLCWSGWGTVRGMGYAGSGQFYKLEDAKDRVRHLKSNTVKYHYRVKE